MMDIFFRKQIVTFFLVLPLSLTLVCCDKDNGELDKFYWEQTKCADPWGTGENDSNQVTFRELQNYLEENGIEVLEITFDNDSTLDIFCESCGCGTGQRIIVTVTESDVMELQGLGFKKFRKTI